MSPIHSFLSEKKKWSPYEREEEEKLKGKKILIAHSPFFFLLTRNWLLSLLINLRIQKFPGCSLIGCGVFATLKSASPLSGWTLS